jgi:hypothetical protein
MPDATPSSRLDATAPAADPAQNSVCQPPLGIARLQALRRSIVAEAGSVPVPQSAAEFEFTRAVLDRIGVGLEPVYTFMFQQMPSLEQLERWVLEQLGGAIDPELIADANAIAAGRASPARLAAQERLERAEPVLTEADLAFWEEHGYVILRDAGPAAACADLRQAIFQRLGAEPDDPDSWYRAPLHQGIMVQLFQAPGIAEIHASPRIHKAFVQLAGTADLVMTSDRCGFNAPVRPDHPYDGTSLHFDLPRFDTPVQSHLQGILYLTDTGESQGAFRCVPGFHRRIDAWLQGLSPASDPNLEDLEALGPIPIAAASGDLIIWDAALPHGPSPNTGAHPRIVHYLTMYPCPPAPARPPG